MTAIVCAIALTLVPAPDGCQRGGHAHAASDPSRGGRATLVLEPIGRVEDWICIHNREGAWNDRHDPYWGGLQMDRGFQRAYGSDMIRLHAGGLADTWTPREQMVVAERARRVRGYAPWPNTARACGLPMGAPV